MGLNLYQDQRLDLLAILIKKQKANFKKRIKISRLILWFLKLKNFSIKKFIKIQMTIN